MKESEIKPTENHKRLRTLYAVSKLLSNIVNVETSFSEILTSAAESFPLLTAVLIEHWEGRPRTTLWQSADATDGGGPALPGPEASACHRIQNSC